MGWIVNTAKRNHWRVSLWYDMEDLIHDGIVCFCRCRDKYDDVANQAHFMALVKTTYTRHIHNLSLVRSRLEEIHIADLVDEDVDTHKSFDKFVYEREEATFLVMVSRLPEEIKDLFVTLVNDARNIKYLTRSDKTRETTNEWLVRIGNLPEGMDIRRVLEDYFVHGKPINLDKSLLFWL